MLQCLLLLSCFIHNISVKFYGIYQISKVRTAKQSNSRKKEHNKTERQISTIFDKSSLDT